MKDKALLIGMGVGVIIALLLSNVAPNATASPHKTSKEQSARLFRACAYATGGWTTVDCSAGAVYSGQLSAQARYVIQCDENAYWAPDDAASGADADANDGYAPKSAWFDFYTDDLVRYYSCDSSALGGGKCRHIECR